MQISNLKSLGDFNEGIYLLHALEKQPIESTFHYVLREDYKLEWRVIEQDSMEFYSCYDSNLIVLLKNRFGNDFLEMAISKSDSLEKTENWKRAAEFPGGNREFYMFINDRLKVKRIDLDESNQTKIIVGFTVTEYGKVENVKILNGIHVNINTQVVEIFQEMPVWKPAYLFGKPVSKWITCPIRMEFR